MPQLFDVTIYGAQGNGINDDWAAMQAALDAAKAVNGCLYLPPGTYRHTQPLVVLGSTAKISIKGDGDNVSVMVSDGGIGALNFEFEQLGQDQPYGLRLEGVGFRAMGRAATAIKVSYGDPLATSDHYQPSTVIRNVTVASGPNGSWSNGICITAAWNVIMTDVYVSGDPAGANWNNMSGNGIEFRRMCVNAHLTGVRCNFWSTGFYYNASDGGNTEGLFFSNCAMVAVKRGVWIIGNAAIAHAPRMSTFTWTGGMVECRVAGVEGGSAAFHLQNVWTALIVGCQMISEALPDTHWTYAIFADTCAGLVVTGCDLNAWHYGLFTIGLCHAISSHGNSFTNCATQTCFNGGTNRSRSYGHVCFNNASHEEDWAGVNKMGFVN